MIAQTMMFKRTWKIKASISFLYTNTQIWIFSFFKVKGRLNLKILQKGLSGLLLNNWYTNTNTNPIYIFLKHWVSINSTPPVYSLYDQ